MGAADARLLLVLHERLLSPRLGLLGGSLRRVYELDLALLPALAAMQVRGARVVEPPLTAIQRLYDGCINGS